MKNIRIAALLSGAFAIHMTATAADLDLYANSQYDNAANLPNVLFIIDNTANWNAAFANEKRALASTLANLPPNKYNVGIMLQTESGGNNLGPAGGYVRAAMRPLNNANRHLYVNLVNSLDKLMDKGAGGASGLAMAEAYHYLMGMAPYSGNHKAKADFTGNGRVSSASDAMYSLSGNALNSYSANRYNAPQSACAKNYIIYISNGPNQQSSSANATTNRLLSAASGGGAATTQIPLSPAGSQENPSDEWARFMKKSSLAVTTYTIDVDPVASGAGPGWTALLKSMSGRSNYTAVTSTGGGVAIADAITDALAKIQSVNSVFAAPSLPLAPGGQGAYLNQVFVGMFRPDPDARPRWMGNLKRYQIDSGMLLADASGRVVIDTATGFFNSCARSFWGPLTPDTYWAEAPQGRCFAAQGEDMTMFPGSNSPDGNIVEKGGQAYRLRMGMPEARVVKTCSPWSGSCTSLLDFNSMTVPRSAVGAESIAEHDALIAWARGANNLGELGKSTTAMRPSAHGDVIHSKPLALSFGEGWGSNVIVFYGSNDGMLHAINGNRDHSFGGAAAGDELWAFMPPEFFPHLKRLRNNSPLVSLAAPAGMAPTGAPKPYGIDGPLTAWREGSSTWIYAAMRRGGRALYAFDVSYPTQPALKWKIGCGPDQTCTDQASGMGQTWSSALPIKARAYGMPAGPMLVMGGGYDACEDTDVNTCSAQSPGRHVYVIDANTGAILKTFDTERGVVGDVTVVPDQEGYAKFGYAADLGGNVYRITMGDAPPSAWSMIKLAALGCDTPAPCTANRKFMAGPSVVTEPDGSYSLYLGSGDREKPLGMAYFPSTSMVSNYFFKITDKPGDLGWNAPEFDNCGTQAMCLASLASAGNTAGNSAGNTADSCGAASVPTAKGWALRLRPGEQVVTPAATRFGVSTFSTHMPDVPVPNSCGGGLGQVHVYNLDIGTGAPAGGSTCSDRVSGGGLPPAPQKFDLCLDNTCSATRAVCIGCSADSAIQPREDVPQGAAAPAVTRSVDR